MVRGLDLETFVRLAVLDHLVERIGSPRIGVAARNRPAVLGLSLGRHAVHFDALEGAGARYDEMRAGLFAADGFVVRPAFRSEDDCGRSYDVDDRYGDRLGDRAAQQVDSRDDGFAVIRLPVHFFRKAVALAVEEFGDGLHGNPFVVRGENVERDALKTGFRLDDGDDRQVIYLVEVGFECIVGIGDGRLGARGIDPVVVVAGCERQNGENPGQYGE